MDRALQMVLLRAVGEGRTSELILDSKDLLHLDFRIRRADLGRGCVEEVGKLSKESLEYCRAYCDGVNSVWKSGKIPWELKLLKVPIEDWKIEDCILLTRLIAFFGMSQLQGDLEKFLFQLLKEGFSLETLQEAFPGLSEIDEERLAILKTVKQIPLDVPFPRPDFVPVLSASNNWVLAGSKTKSGSTMLCNDPHLEVGQLPPFWYEVWLESGDEFFAGATIPGLPVVLLGRNRNLSWGATYTFMDSTDFWIEEVRDRKFKNSNGWRVLKARTEVFKRKKGSIEYRDFYETDRGVLVQDFDGDGFYLSERWASCWNTGAKSIDRFFQLIHLNTVKEAAKIIGEVETSWNWVLADRSGEIGYQMSGLFPVRKGSGLIPRIGWVEEESWQGFVDFVNLPREFNPERGFIVTANNDLNAFGKVAPIETSMGSDRSDRISEILKERNDWDISLCHQLQRDVGSKHAERFMKVLRPLLKEGPADGLLQKWDCSYPPESVAAFYFEAFLNELRSLVFGEALGPQFTRTLLEKSGIFSHAFSQLDGVLLDPQSRFLGTKRQEAWFLRAWERVRSLPPRTWGQENVLIAKHLLLGDKLPNLFGFNFGPVPFQGGRATPHQAQVFWVGPQKRTVGPSYYLLTELSTDEIHTALPGGQSDRRFSSRYGRAEFERWRTGKLKRVHKNSIP